MKMILNNIPKTSVFGGVAKLLVSTGFIRSDVIDHVISNSNSPDFARESFMDMKRRICDKTLRVPELAYFAPAIISTIYSLFPEGLPAFKLKLLWSDTSDSVRFGSSAGYPSLLKKREHIAEMETFVSEFTRDVTTLFKYIRQP